MPKKKNLLSFQWQTLTSTISTTFVLILLGLTVLCALTAKNVGDSVKQSLTVTAILTDEATEASSLKLKQQLEKEHWIKDINYISAEKALKEQTEAMGTDPSEFLGENPYTPLLEMHLEADYACTDSLVWITKEVKQKALVADVVYQKDLVERLNRNLTKLSYVLLAISVVLLVITIVLINNTVRLSVYSRRFVIHTMRLVGASWSFIRRPFMLRSLYIGLTAGLLACASLGAALHTLIQYDSQMLVYLPLENLIITGVSVIASGLLLTLVCTFISVSHFLSLPESKLYG